MDNNFFGNDNLVNRGGKSPIYFVGEEDNWQVNPIYKIDEVKNTPDRFVIVKTTANGKFLIGDMIHYNYNGIEIITDATNAIFVDKNNKTVFVREYEKALRSINPEDPEQRQYVLLMVDNDGDENDYYQWCAMVGRTTMYEYIKSYVTGFDVRKSIILTDNVPLKDALSVSQFVHYLQNSQLVDDDGFNIDEYEEE